MNAPATTRRNAATARKHRAWPFTAGPAILVVLPLLGMSLKSDERLHLFQQVYFTDVNLFGIGRYVEERLVNFLNIGNFRPIGRFTEVLVHGVVFEAAEATGLTPHVLVGVVRVAVVALLAVLAAKMVQALARSAGVDADRSLVGLYPLAMGAVIVANGIIGGLAQFPHTFIGAVVLILAATLAIIRDRDLHPRPMRKREYASMALFGAVLVMFYDVAYLAPLVAGAFLIARVAVARVALRAALATAAVRRWAAFSAGFAAVFIPVRIDIARRCARDACYTASDLSISPEAFETALPRLATGLPPVGWDYNADLARLFAVDAGLADLATNAVLAVMLAGIVAMAVAAAARGWRSDRAGTAETAATAATAGTAATDAAATTATPPRNAHVRLAIALAGLGAFMAILSASLAGLSASMQQRNLPMGEAWREAQLAQLAWSLIIAGGLAALDLAARSEGARRALRAAVAAVLAVGLMFTFLANWRFAEVDRRDPTAAVTSLIAVSTIHLDNSETGDTIRCLLINGYVQVTPEKVWITGWRLRNDLDRFMGERHGLPYCYPSTVDNP
ncbi:hypothetical protein [Candidatus Poriferisodalis sp.]|uniref:hypothetical protein n=1 Tax=Candidatus Poriferisodalis sp. TaxID=3101277 RepID=UPI003C6F5B81